MWLLSKNAGFCCLFGAQVSAAYALTEGDASGPAQTLLAADTESDSDPDSGIATLPDLTEEHPVTLQPDEESAPSDDASSGTQVVYYADPSDPDEPGDADTDVEIDPDGVDFGQYITKSEAQWRKNKNDSWHSWDELAGGALGYGDGLKFRLEYTLPTGSLWKNGTGQPDTIIFYQLPETLKNFTGSDKVYADHVAVGEYEIRDGVVTIHFTDMDYIGKSKESDMKGTIELSGTVSQLKADDDGKVELDFNKDVRFEMTVKPKPVDLSIVKKGIQKDVAHNKITYQVTVSTEEGTQGTPVLLHDALQLNLGKALVGAKYDENSLKVSLDVEKNGNDKIYENTAPEGETANGWSVKTAADGKSFDLTLPALEAGESYTINYSCDLEDADKLRSDFVVRNTATASAGKGDTRTEVTSNQIQYTISGLISKSGEWHTDHTITWTVKLNQNNADLTGTVLRDFFGGTDEANELKNQEAKMKRVAPGTNINDVTSVDVQLPYYFGYKDGIKNGTPLGGLDNAYYEFSYTTPDTPMLGNGNAAWNRAYLITGDSVLNNNPYSTRSVAAKLGDRYQKEGIGVEENGDTLTLNWELTLNPVRAQNGWTLTDTLKDGQYLTAEQKNDLKTKLEALPGFGTGTVTFGADGLLKTVGSDNRNLLQTGVAYRMVELEAPHGYELRMEPFDFYIDTEPANTPKDYAGQLCFTGQRVFIPNTRGYYDPQLTKNILESGSPVKRNTAPPGETVQFQTAIQVAHGQPSKYVLHDAMSGLNFDAASLKITHPVGDESGKQIEQTLKENIDYTLKKDCEDGCAFEITFSDERLTPGDLLTLTYSATVREDAVVEGEGNPNTTWLEYADPTGSSTTGEEETRTAAAPMPDNHKNKVMGAVDSLIQTGQLNWPIPVLLTLGGALVLAGLVLTRRKNRR